jgi:hypothetical protein
LDLVFHVLGISWTNLISAALGVCFFTVLGREKFSCIASNAPEAPVLPLVAGLDGFPWSNGSALCSKWSSEFKSLSSPPYSIGTDTVSCTSGTAAPTARSDLLRVVNLYRYLAGIDPLAEDTNLVRPVFFCSPSVPKSYIQVSLR